jgi:hypothetical protein
MQVPVSLKIRDGLHALTRKFVTEILVSSLTTVLVMALFPNMTKPASLFARNDERLASVQGSPAGGETMLIGMLDNTTRARARDGDYEGDYADLDYLF